MLLIFGAEHFPRLFAPIDPVKALHFHHRADPPVLPPKRHRFSLPDLVRPILRHRKSDGQRPDRSVRQAHPVPDRKIILLPQKSGEGGKHPGSDALQIGKGDRRNLPAGEFLRPPQPFLPFPFGGNPADQGAAVRSDGSRHCDSPFRFGCRPHSVLSNPAQRPARKSWPGLTGMVQGWHPMLGYWRSCSGL